LAGGLALRKTLALIWMRKRKETPRTMKVTTMKRMKEAIRYRCTVSVSGEI
jgi:hypothetical protein